MTDPAAQAAMVFSTDFLPERERFDAWRETFALKVGRVDIATADKGGFKAHIRAQPMPQVTLSESMFSACDLMRTPSLMRDGDDSVALIVCLGGRGDWRFGDTGAVVTAGQAMLVSHGHEGSARIEEGGRTYTLRLERAHAQAFTPALERALNRPTQPNDPAVALLAGYCGQLMKLPAGMSPALAGLAGGQLSELAAHILNPTCDLARAAPFGGVKAARLRAALADIAANLADPGLSAAKVAQRLRLTERYVRQLLDGVDLTFSHHVRQLRLEQAHRMLRDVRSQHLRITDIVYAVGFQDLSYFNREFRRHYGVTPSETRRVH